MCPEIVTASAVISFVERVEDGSKAFYEDLASRFEEYADRFQTYAKGSAKIKTSIVRTYRETITDAIEACYSFEGMDLGEYVVDAELPHGSSLPDALSLALELEKRTEALYLEVAHRSQALLATIPRAFSRAAKKRGQRSEELQSLLAAA